MSQTTEKTTKTIRAERERKQLAAKLREGRVGTPVAYDPNAFEAHLRKVIAAVAKR